MTLCSCLLGLYAIKGNNYSIATNATIWRETLVGKSLANLLQNHVWRNKIWRICLTYLVLRDILLVHAHVRSRLLRKRCI